MKLTKMWKHAFTFWRRLKRRELSLFEQPLPDSMIEESVYLKKYSPFKLFADESITKESGFFHPQKNV